MAYPMRANRSYDLSSAHRARGLSADERYARKVAARWALVAVSAEKDPARALYLSGHITEDEFAARWNAADDKILRCGAGRVSRAGGLHADDGHHAGDVCSGSLAGADMGSGTNGKRMCGKAGGVMAMSEKQHLNTSQNFPRMTIIAGDPATAAPLSAEQELVLASLTIDQWPSIAPIYARTQAEAQRAAIAGMTDEARQGVGESLLRFVSAQYESNPRVRAFIDSEVLCRTEEEAQATGEGEAA